MGEDQIINVDELRKMIPLTLIEKINMILQINQEKLISKKNIVIGCVDLWQLQQTADLLIEKNYKIYHDGRSLQLYISL